MKETPRAVEVIIVIIFLVGLFTILYYIYKACHYVYDFYTGNNTC